MSSIADETYVLFTTFTKTGRPKSTPVWIVETEGLVGFTTEADSWKVRRLRNNPACTMQPCDSRGRTRPGSSVVEATAREATPAETNVILDGIKAKYGLVAKWVIPVAYRLMALAQRRRLGPTTGVVVDLDHET